MSEIEQTLRRLKAEPTQLPPAPDGDVGAAIEERRQSGAHTCAHCGDRARVAYVAETQIGYRWLDLCAACDLQMRTR